MDTAPIHTAESIEKYIVNRGYGCVCPPLYLPKFDPSEQFRFVVKSKLKREKLLDNETLANRISEACNKILFSDWKGFCRYSTSKLGLCLNNILFKFGILCQK
jgi:hypothetical protein